MNKPSKSVLLFIQNVLVFYFQKKNLKFEVVTFIDSLIISKTLVCRYELEKIEFIIKIYFFVLLKDLCI